MLGLSSEGHRLAAGNALDQIETHLNGAIIALRSRKCGAAHHLVDLATKSLHEAHAHLSSMAEDAVLVGRYLELHKAVAGAHHNFSQLCIKKTLENTCSLVSGR